MQNNQLDPVLRNLSNSHRRAVLQILQNRNGPVSDEEVATHFVAKKQEKRLIDVTEPEIQSACIDLRHNHFPALETAGLIKWDTTAKTVTTSDHPVLRNPELIRVIETEREGWDDVLASLIHKRRRITLFVLAEYDRPLARVALAREIAAHETEDDESVDSVPIDTICISLHHIHLPKLTEAGLIEYDICSGTVRYRGHPLLEDEAWFDPSLAETSAVFSL